ncbi:MAG: glutamine--tRNA ligase/YqeY domain fusion protein [Bacteroidales bacterium]|jgi:glutaminyl-tRNA synthetase|nr:glutamine--tRNA ligase/YqeY domain fusion protein [Bacteroidales bacterium]
MEERKLNFLEEIIEKDLAEGKVDSIMTRFPPEPNGYLHLGHAKSICLNFGLAQKYGGKTNLRYDDTNPTKEDTEYVDSIKEDIKWLGFQWDKELYASDYFDQLYEWAEDLIKRGLAYVDDQTQEEIRLNRGTVDKPGTPSPWRDRTPEENLKLFREMKAGKYAEGEKVLRAKIDMAHPNMMFRDPLLYRIKFAHHHRTGDKWCIYPMYDYTHGQCDSIEHITHSICTLEFDVHRPLYDWFIQTLGIYPSHQYEFARLNLTYTLMSKRKLLELVQKGLVSGWDDPRMPTLCGVRRRGYTAGALKMFCDKIGVSKRDQLMDIQLLEWCVRQDLNERSNRYMVVQDPIKLTITNWPEGKVEWFDCPLNPADPEGAKRRVPFTGNLLIDRADFMEDAPKKFFRLKPDGEVRLKYTYIVKCNEVIKDNNGEVTELKCTYDPSTEYRAVKGTIHWVSEAHAKELELRNYDRLFTLADMSQVPEDKDYKDFLNPESLVLGKGYAEPALLEDHSGIAVQFERTGYFVKDKDSTPEHPVFNKTTSLKDSYKPE